MRKKHFFTFVLAFVLFTLIFVDYQVQASSNSLETAVEKVNDYWLLEPEFQKDKNIIEFLESKLKQDGFTDINISIKEAVSARNDAASIKADGTLNYHFIDPNLDSSAANSGVSNLWPIFILEKDGKKLETEKKTVQLRWDEDRVIELLKSEVDTYFKDGLAEIIKPNKDAKNVISNFNLPKGLNDKAWLNSTWSSNSRQLKIDNIKTGLDKNNKYFAYYPVKVEQSTTDQNVQLSLKVNFNKSGGEHISYEKTFDLIIPKPVVDLVELKKEMQKDIDEYFNESVLKYANPNQNETFDPEAVKHSIGLPISRNIRRDTKDSAGNVVSKGIKDLFKKYKTSGKGFSFFKVEDISKSKDNVGASIKSSMLNINVPKDGEAPHRVRLTMTLKHKDYNLEVNKSIDLVLVPNDYDVLKTKIAKYKKLMDLAKDNIFTALNSNPENTPNEGPDKITNNLSLVKEIRFKNPDNPEDNTLEYIYAYKEIIGDGIIPAALDNWEIQEAYRTAKSSYPEYLSHENLIVNRPAKDTEVVLEMKLTTPIMEEYKNYFDADYNSQIKQDLESLFDQNIKLNLTILGEVKNEDNNQEAPEPTPETPDGTSKPEPGQGSDNSDKDTDKAYILETNTEESDLDLEATLEAKPEEDLILTVNKKDPKALASDQYTFTEVFDINLIISSGEKVQPSSNLTISLRPNTELEENTVLIHEVIENGVSRLEKVDYTVTEDAKGKLIKFEVNRLSLFGLGKAADKSEAGTNNSTEATSSTSTSDISPESTEESQTTLETIDKLAEPTATKDTNDNRGNTAANTQGISANEIANGTKSTAQVPAVTGEKAAMPMIFSFILLAISGAMLVFRARREE